jgi:chaperonin GroES
MSEALSVAHIKPLAGYVLVQPAEAEKQTASGIYLPDSSTERPQHGTVLAVGPAIMEDGQKVESPVKVKDKVLYKEWGGNKVKIGDIEYQFLKFEDLLAVVSK